MKKTTAPKIGTTVLVLQDGRECAGIAQCTIGLVTGVRMVEGRNAGRLLEVPTARLRIPAAFEVVV